MGNLLIDENPLIVLPSLVKKCNGNVTKAMLLQQIHFLLRQPRSGIDHDDQHWIWKTAEEWVEDGFIWLKPSSISKALRELEEDELIISVSRIRDAWNPTKYYRLSPMLLQSHTYVDSNLHTYVDSSTHTYVDSSGPLITETTSETTSETTNTLPTRDGDRPFEPWTPKAKQAGPPTAFNLLTDSFVGMYDSVAKKFKDMDPELVIRIVFKWKADNVSVKVLPSRLLADKNPPELQHTDRRHPYYERHFGKYDFDAAEAAERSEYATWDEVVAA